MGQKPAGGDKDEPSLELPSFRVPGSRRRKPGGQRRKGREAAPVVEDAPPAAEAPVEQPPVEQPPAPEVTPARGRRADRKGASSPVPVPVATFVTGLVVGASGAVLTYLGMAGCESLRGTSTCGGPGVFLLVAILILMVLLGMLLLKAWKVSDPGSSSFLGVGIVTVVVLLTLMDEVYSVWMFLAVPLISAAAYIVGHWVTTRFMEESREGPPHYDVR